ncbi:MULTISPECIES: type IV pilus biogenesis protein PilP [Achromobacter]|uniref:type IV pilus biogenesis protein PilP n=1 Tax=Achromobacter TaxID=222 RepID=UPI0023F75D27|nr:type IV pilus biogenesis protein PilP [Achromobacter anxifer]MDF8363280.1 type IV pilus biogenesis protein PilP [Achromobacter anxifer]
MFKTKFAGRFSTIGLAAAIGLAMGAPAAQAQSAEELTRVQKATALLRAQIEETKARNELEELKRGPTASNQVTVSRVSPTGSSTGAVSAERPPHVLAIFGVDKVLYASLFFPSGVKQDVRVGDSVDGGYVVSSITPSRVTLTKGGEKYPLNVFSVSNQATASSGAARQGLSPSIVSPR